AASLHDALPLYRPPREVRNVRVLHSCGTTGPSRAHVLVLEDLLSGVSCFLALEDDDGLLLQFLEQRQIVEGPRLVEGFPQPRLIALVAIAIRHRNDCLIDPAVRALRLETMHKPYDGPVRFPISPGPDRFPVLRVLKLLGFRYILGYRTHRTPRLRRLLLGPEVPV